jgi:hypothetical protein
MARRRRHRHSGYSHAKHVRAAKLGWRRRKAHHGRGR